MTTMDDQLGRDTEAARVAFEKFLLAPYATEVTPECDDPIGDGCHDPAIFVGSCNACRETVLYCGPHYQTAHVANTRFGVPAWCGACGAGPDIAETFTFELLRSPA